MSLPYTVLMQQALTQSAQAAAAGEVPVGALLVRADGTIVAQAHNLSETQKNPLAHAEMLVLQQAMQATGERYFSTCTLVVTLEPCALCAAALCATRVGTVVFGAYDPKSGGMVSGARVPQHAHHKPNIMGGICEDACQTQLQTFFQTLR